MDDLSFWLLVVWSIANVALWCDAQRLYRKTRRTAGETRDLLDDVERWRLRGHRP